MVGSRPEAISVLTDSYHYPSRLAVVKKRNQSSTKKTESPHTSAQCYCRAEEWHTRNWLVAATHLKGDTNLAFLFRTDYVLSSPQITQTGGGGISALAFLFAFIHWLHDFISSQQCNPFQLELQTKGLYPWVTLHIGLLWVHVNIVLR